MINKQIKVTRTKYIYIYIYGVWKFSHPLKCLHSHIGLYYNETLLPFTTQILLGFLGNSRDYGHNKEQFSNMCTVMLGRQRLTKKKERKLVKKSNQQQSFKNTNILLCNKFFRRMNHSTKFFLFFTFNTIVNCCNIFF